MFIMGVDLSGPSNHKDTAAALFRLEGETMHLEELQTGLSDANILELAEKTDGSSLAVGLDAPLSYNDGGGDRPSDKWFRKEMARHGLRSSSIMPPTLTRMVYLTVRGLKVASLLEGMGTNLKMAEVHPGSALLTRLNDGEKEHGLLYKNAAESRTYVVNWFARQSIYGIPEEAAESAHSIDAIAAAMAVRDWIRSAPKLIYPKSPPHHPYDFLC
ncbi:DUF429 domain-containing protein [Metabacillus sp. 84]|uniref:DUF429 domain-containing protein n=1 Tax=unclassified Metabacillus TaxID=2675274 RepID=UPI003CF76F55